MSEISCKIKVACHFDILFMIMWFCKKNKLIISLIWFLIPFNRHCEIIGKCSVLNKKTFQIGYQLKPKTAKRNDWNETSQTTQTTNQNGCNEQNKRTTVTRKKKQTKKKHYNYWNKWRMKCHGKCWFHLRYSLPFRHLNVKAVSWYFITLVVSAVLFCCFRFLVHIFRQKYMLILPTCLLNHVLIW